MDGAGVARTLWVVVALGVVALGVRLASSLGAPDTWATAPLLGAFPLAAVALVVAALGGTAAFGVIRSPAVRRPVAVVGCCAVAAVTLLLPRAVAAPQPPADGPAVVVGLVNVRRGLADPVRVARLAQEGGVDVLVVIELTPGFADALGAAGTDEQLPERVLAPTATTAGGGVWSRHPLTVPAPPDPAGDTPDVDVEVPGGGTLQVVTTHPVPPIGPDRTARWRRGLAAIAPPPADRPAIVAGDMNATTDHATFRDVLATGWRDAAQEVGAGTRWTYDGVLAGSPAVPMALDHVLVGPGIAVDGVDVDPVDGTDHRMVIVELRLPSVAHPGA